MATLLIIDDDVDVREMLSDAAATDGTGYAVTHTSYFPGNRRAIGDRFAYHELRVAYDRT